MIKPWFTDEEWKQISLGYIKAVRLSCKDPEAQAWLDEVTSHRTNRLSYDELYGSGKHEYVELPPWQNMDARLHQACQLIKMHDKHHVLDIGSRAGFLGYACLEKGFIKSYTGVEIETKWYDACVRAAHPQAQFYNCDYMDLDLTQQFDCITILDTLEHVYDPQAVIEKTHRHLTKDGILIISVPEDRSLVTEAEKEIMSGWKYLEHINYWLIDDMRALLEIHGYRLEQSLLTTGSWACRIYVAMKG